MTEYQDITLKTADGRTIYFPRDYQYIRYAPVVCREVVTRIVQLRFLIEDLVSQGEISPFARTELEDYLAPVVMEDKFMSGKTLDVHNAIVELIENNPPRKEGDAM